MVFPRLPLLWRVFAINAGLLVLGTLALVVFPRRVHVSTGVFESFDVIAGVVLVLAANFLLLRPVLSPAATPRASTGKAPPRGRSHCFAKFAQSDPPGTQRHCRG